MKIVALLGFLFAAFADASPTPPKSTWLVNEWQCGKGVLAVGLSVNIATDGSVIGRLAWTYDAGQDAVTEWRLVLEGSDTVLYISTVEGRTIRYTAIPAPADELSFINLTEAESKRIDFAHDGHELLLKFIGADSMTQLRFRPLETQSTG